MSLPYKATLASPCKLNLTLDVGLPRPDGFHELDSLVVLLSAADEVTVTVKPGPRTVKLIVKDRRPDSVASEPMPKGAENLAHKAAQLALDTLAPGQELQVWITLAKRLPAQAGLGAGSSNAATVLQAVGAALEASADALLPLAAQLGSDVALFLAPPAPSAPPAPTSGGAYVVRMRGRGERVEPVALELPKLYGVLTRPAVGVPTGPAYALLDALPNRLPGTATEALLTNTGLAPPLVGAGGAALSNDFEAAVLPAFPEVAALHAALTEAGAVRALLCGSGSSVFGLARDRAHALELVKKLAGRVAWLKLVESL
ncbi:4-(cytidine 5'-diphospho)-2-C-methyl-D-erythritol kinase [Armatimonas rosea]|uniref:4-diphosphocytidyl-2-C-methyl-D-erythritol kinase n=1 Tax=Armatimonas rosea TaxID=685828 RepID=A0A7W9SRE0_ARMRO|nr:4-(cytidine 5'-diphospho)-2-C-methyl-D-erythritol kinase [Armatimonas rosea]MBB6050858.1 4-diphosphocytidyl-2-C-methyl-D-erythritol kinase [Armatimonas rosea]